MPPELLTSRKNEIVVHMRKLCSDKEYRRQSKEFVCEGEKLLSEALIEKAEITRVLWNEKVLSDIPHLPEQYTVKEELAAYISPLKNSGGPIFSVRMKDRHLPREAKRAIVLDGVGDPGNVGTVIRTADAMGVDAVILLDRCADPYNPKTVRATMGAIFRQYIRTEQQMHGLAGFLHSHGLKLYGASNTKNAVDIRETDLKKAAIAIGNEGGGLSRELMDLCDGLIVIPIAPECESLNAAVAAAVIMWEGFR
ncbi:MAG: RNA methyltransferase [Oscillospiraceae bacterium]|nr:RNA methyltransferase [Oscillospiraceae bacterium]